MKKSYNNVKRFDDTYYSAPRKFYNELIKEGKLREDTEYSLSHVPLSTKEDTITDLYSVITEIEWGSEDYQKHSGIVLQFERQYNTKDNTLVIQSI